MNDEHPGRWRCLACGYVLDGLPESRCPECGREFDSRDSRTIDEGPSAPGRGVAFLQGACALWPLVPFVAVHVLWMGRWIIDDRRPGPGRIPNEVAESADGMLVMVLAAPVLGTPVAAIVLLGGYAAHAGTRTDWGWVLRRAALTILALAAAVGLWRLDLLGVRAWFSS